MTETVLDRLDKFRREVNLNLATGVLADEPLQVVDDEGRFPVVAALGEERLSVLMRRVKNAGGYASAFIDMGSSVSVLSFIDSSCSIDADSAEDLASDGTRPGAQATVGMFVEYLMLKPNGVRLPPEFESSERPFVPSPRAVEFQPA